MEETIAFPVVSQSLQKLNEQSQNRTFSLDDVDWTLSVDFTKPWMPESLVAASYLPSYAKLQPAVRLRFNQLQAQSICEQFIWFEEYLIVPILRNLTATNPLEADLRQCLEQFANEEIRHSEMFRRVLRKTNANAYATNDNFIFQLTPIQKAFFNQIITRPNLFLTWIWMAIYFEEKTLLFSRAYQRAKSDLTIDIDSLFHRVHQLHMIDEARHLQIDQYLLKAFYPKKPGPKRTIAAKASEVIFRAYRSPKRNTLRIVEELKNHFSDPALDQILAELPTLASNPNFQDQMFSDKAIPRTRQLLNHYPEMKNALVILD